ncbi:MULTISPECIES: AbgT family transporter [Hyphomonas]|jgi:aminobenzoyl-glutamate transport protein|uniref:AbgT family transporter n=1 Tax=Hyphomonas TaxID=85 RepID=UPI003514EC8A
MAETVTNKGFLGWVEKTGNRLPDPVFLFFYLIIALMAISQIAAWTSFSAPHPTQVTDGGTPLIIESASLFSAENIQRLWVEMPKTFTHFHPLGYVLVVMLGAGVAERSGLFSSAIRAAVRNAPKFLLTPLVALVAMLSNHAADAGYVVMIPLAGILFASAGRHPLAGIAAAFAGVSGGFSANISPGQLDALLFGITEAAYGASNIDAGWTMNIAGNTYFIIALLLIYLPVIWFVTDKVIEPRLGKWTPAPDAAVQAGDEDKPLTAEQQKGLRMAGLAVLGVCALWALMTFGPGTPLLADGPGTDGDPWYQKAGPFFRSLVAGFLILFLAAGWAYGAAANTINNHRDLVNMMTEAMKDLGYYLVLAFAAAHFVAMFGWSNLGLISAVHGADAIQSSGLPLPIVLGLIVLFSALLNLFVGSASAKWALLAPVLVPMLMLLGVSPEGATAAYRVGDGATNIITPLMVYFPLILVFARRWQTDFGLGSLTAMMIPYSIWMLITGVVLMMGWIFLGLDFGPGAPAHITVPGTGG